MPTITVENVPETVFKSFGSKVSYNEINSSFFTKKREYFSKNFVSPDLKFTSYDDMTPEHRKEYDKISKMDKSNLINV